MTKIVFGAAGLTSSGKFNSEALRAQVLDTLLSHNVTTIDTARLYADSETCIGALESRTKFTIDTKLPGGFQPGGLRKAQVLADTNDSLKTVGIKQFDIFYIHAPDPSIPFAETLDGVNEAHRAGIFKRFGLSNFSAAQVREIHGICKDKGYVLPTVYQGNFSPVARHLETMLFPTLRELGIAFYAYSPLAGGFLTKSAKELDEGAGRFNESVIGGLYSKLYDSPTMREALVTWNEIADKEGVSKAELAYRWVAHHALKDEFAKGEENGVIFGASSIEQIEGTIKGIKKGSLSAEAVQGIEKIWKSVQEVAPVDNYHKFQK